MKTFDPIRTDESASSAKVVILMALVVGIVFAVIGGSIWFRAVGADYRYLSCMSCHM